MTRLWKHPVSGYHWFRKRIPDDLREALGKREERFSLGTRDPHEAKRLHAQKLAEVEERWSNLRRGQRPLSPEDIARGREERASNADADAWSLRAIGRVLNRRKIWIVLSTLAAVVLSLVAVDWVPPRYKAEAWILVGDRESNFERFNSDHETPGVEAIATQVQVVLSGDLARAIIKKNKLAERPEFDPVLQGISPLRALAALLGIGRDPFSMTPEERVLDAYFERLRAYAVDKSRVIIVEFQSQDPELSAGVANSLADGYLNLRKSIRQGQAKAAAQWLPAEIENQRKRVTDAESQIADFRARSNQDAPSNNQNAQLRALEREAKTQRDLLESYSDEYRRATSWENPEIVSSDDRIISRAIAPNVPVYPSKLPIVLIAALAMLALSAGGIVMAALVRSASPKHLPSFPINTLAIDADAWSFRAIGRVLNRRKSWIVLSTLAVVVLSLVAIDWVPPRYKAEARILVEDHESNFKRFNSDHETPGVEAIATQVQVVLSGDLARAIIKKNKLAERPEFDPVLKGISPLRALAALLGIGRDPFSMTPEERVLDAYFERLRAYAVDKSRVIIVEFQSQDPELSAEVANSLADGYLNLRKSIRQGQAKAAAQWLPGEIENQRKKVADAELQIADFRERSNQAVPSNDQNVQLRALEREAKTQRDLLELYLDEYRRATLWENPKIVSSDDRIISRAIISNVPVYPKKLPIVLIAALAMLALSTGSIVAATLLPKSSPLASSSDKSVFWRSYRRQHLYQMLRRVKMPSLNIERDGRVRWGLAACLSLILGFFLKDTWQSFFPICFAGFICFGLLFQGPWFDRIFQWFGIGRRERSEIDGELLAKLRADWLKPTSAEKGTAVVLLLFPLAFHIASFIFGIAADGAQITAIMRYSPYYGAVIIGSYRKYRKRRQAVLNKRAFELTQDGSDFILYLRSFNTSNRLRVRNTMPKTLDRLLVGVFWDIEYAFSHAFESTAPLVAIGSKGAGIGAAKIQTDDLHWEAVFGELAEKARAILIVPSITPGTRHEISTIAKMEHLLRKTIWVMPPTYWGIRSLWQRLFTRSPKESWEEARREIGEVLELPPYRRSGALVYARSSGRECKQFPADDLAPDRVCPLIDAVIEAGKLDGDAGARAAEALVISKRSARYQLEEWLFRRWIAGFGSVVNFDLLILCGIAVAFLFAPLLALEDLGGVVPLTIVKNTMMPTLLPGDTIIADFWSSPKRGDVIAVPGNGGTFMDRKYGIVRLFGLPRDRISLDHGVVYINGAAVVQQPDTDIYNGALAEFRNESSDCPVETNTLPEGVQFRSVSCGKTAGSKAAQNVAEFVVSPDEYLVSLDNEDYRPFLLTIKRAEVDGKAGVIRFILFSVKQAHESIFTRIRWHRVFKGA